MENYSIKKGFIKNYVKSNWSRKYDYILLIININSMIEKTSENNNPILTFEGKKYKINDLSKEVKEIIRGLQIAETQLKCMKIHWN